MAVQLTVNGVTYNYPELTDEGWGPDATNWAVAITQGVLTKAGGLFSLTSDIDFGPNFGLKSVYYKSRSANIATAGQIRLANADVISFRNALNSANLNFGPGSADAIPQWNGIDLVNLSTAQTLTNKTIVGATFTGGIFNSPTINTPTVTGGTFTSPSISGASISGSTISTSTLVSPSISNPTMTGVSLFPNGSAAIPSIAFTNSPSTGIFRHAADTIGFSSAGSEIAFANATAWNFLTGQVSIGPGTSGAQSVIAVEGVTDGFLVLSGSNGGVQGGIIQLFGNTNGALPNAIRFKTNNLVAGLIDNNQAWQIGETGGVQSHIINGYSTNLFGARTGDDVLFGVRNSVSGNTSSGAVSYLEVNGATAGDPYVKFNISGVQNWVAGVDNSDSDKFKISASNLLGSGDIIAFTTAGQAQFNNGTAGAPSVSFINDTDTGLYLAAPGTLALSVDSGAVWSATNAASTFYSPILAQPGSAAAPSFSFAADPDTGIFRGGVNTLSFSAGGGTRFQINDSNYIESTVPIYSLNGNSSSPSFAFIGAPSTGLYNFGSNSLGFTTNGADAGNISNAQKWTIGASGGTQTHVVNGSLQVSQQILSFAGTVGAPGIAFTAEPSSGFYRDSGGSFIASILGASKLQISTDIVAFTNVDVRSSSALKLFGDGGNTKSVNLSAPSTIAATYNVVFPAAAPATNTTLAYNGTDYVWTPVGSPILTSVTLTDNTTNGTAATFTSATTNTVFVKYSLKRGTAFQTGELKIVNDGTTPQIVDANVPINDCGTVFSVDISGANLRLLYTTTSTGTAVSMKYTVESWQA